MNRRRKRKRKKGGKKRKKGRRRTGNIGEEGGKRKREKRREGKEKIESKSEIRVQDSTAGWRVRHSLTYVLHYALRITLIITFL